ncbi:major facilitator superfamily transporter [Nannizzia gypsea CBS 118893]|uniref:Major facilitator superfamily transporter n=1 Tax=Arthroderma gypseum (strain ATCC MYA-4604 / CBS 118893) TaxID=535722 RepID=E5R287_ARTGP|nr:major facilitator superfamily transporter [Nannizzia gypsea CBS 118893]EFQ96977.1 major facilitator superfamily transporter [Nannizzia gypsea CBS 118893]
MAVQTTTKTEMQSLSPSTDIVEMCPLGTSSRVLAPKTSNSDSTRVDIRYPEPHAAPEEAQVYPTGMKFWLLVLTLSALIILGGLDANIVASAVPSITDDFHTASDVGWYSSAFRLCSCVFQLVFGKLYKLFSIKRIFLLAQAFFLLGSLLCATATASPMLILGRAVTGVGFAGLIGGLFIILVYILPLHRRPFFCGLFGMVESAAVLAAPIVGGLLTESLGWRWCFWINLPIGAVTLLMTIFLFSDPKPSNTSITLGQKLLELDPLSNLLFIPALASLFLALSWAGTKYAWDDGRVIGPLVTFAVLMAAFLYNQRRRGNAAAVPPHILKSRNVIAGIIFTICSNSCVNVLEYYLPSYYQVVHEYSPSRSGYMMIPIVVGATIGMLICGSGTSIFGYYTPFMLLSSTLMPIFAGLITTFGVNTSFIRHLLYSGAFGVASGVGFNAPISAVQTVLPKDDVSLGLSIVLFAQHFGPAVSVAIAQVIFTSQLSTNLSRVVPGLNTASIESNGLLALARHAPPAQHGEILAGAGRSFGETWYLAAGLACVTLVGSLLMEWQSVKQKNA